MIINNSRAQPPKHISTSTVMGNFTSSPQTPKTARDPFTGDADDLNYLARIKRAEDARKEAIAANTHDRNKENQQLLKKLFKRLDPSVSEANTDVQGEIQLSLKYDFNNSKLLINVIKCRDLCINAISGKTAEPFVSMFVYPDPDDHGAKFTSKSTNATNPVFNEKFFFPLEEVSLTDSKLIFKVIDHDMVNDDMELLGEVIVNLNDINFLETPVHTAWYTLRPETDVAITGELDIGLDFTLPKTLSVTVHQATNLKLTNQKVAPDPVVKVSIPGVEQVSVTEMQPEEANPSWNETFAFEVAQEDLAVRYIVFTVLNQASSVDSLLGHVVIDLDNLDVEKGYRGLFPLSDMSNSDRLRSKWFQTTQVQEFREALWAHSYFTYPSLLFTNHTGRKVIRLTCEGAGAKAKLRINNGIPVV